MNALETEHDLEGAAPQQKSMVVDVARNRYPYSITWLPLPCVTCCCPCVGHMGVADSQGVIYDFAGPFRIGKEYMAFGSPTRYLQLNPELIHGDEWDSSIE